MTLVNDLDDLLEDPHLNDVGFWRSVEHPTEGAIRQTDIPPTFSKSPGSVRRHAPRFGEHTRELLGEAGISDKDIDAMIASGAALQASD